MWNKTIRTQDDLKRMERHYRTVGYDDGYAGRPATSKSAVYQAAWRQGREARRAEERDDVTELLEHLRTLGLPMGSRYAPLTMTDEHGEAYTQTRYVGWTTDAEKAAAAHEAGAVVIEYRSTDDRFCGFEVSVGVVDAA